MPAAIILLLTIQMLMQPQRPQRIILGIDPGTLVMGYGLIESGTKPKLIALGVLKLEKYDDHSLRLKKIFEKVTSLIDQYLPDEMAVEAPFFGKNVQSMLKLGRAQGVAIAAAMQRELPITEYSPRKIKQSVTGNGNSSKDQVAAMLTHLLQGAPDLRNEKIDATDAIAAAFCHCLQSQTTINGKKSGGWDSFLKNNPGREVKKG